MKTIREYKKCSMLLAVATAFVLVGCGEQIEPVAMSDAQLDELLRVGGPGPAVIGDDKCSSRVQVGKVCERFFMLAPPVIFFNTRAEAEANILRYCNDEVASDQFYVRQSADQEKEKCEADVNPSDGNKDCDFWTSEEFSSCTLEKCFNYIDGGGDNPDVACVYAAGSTEGTCRQLPAGFTTIDKWSCHAGARSQCIKVSCKI